MSGSVAYVSQDPWLVNDIMKENILFGCRYDPELYQKTVETWALIADLEVLPHGHDTEIGERRVSLSGGQKSMWLCQSGVLSPVDLDGVIAVALGELLAESMGREQCEVPLKPILLVLDPRASVFAVFRSISGQISCGLRASRPLHDTMAYKVLRSPMSFSLRRPLDELSTGFRVM